MFKIISKQKFSIPKHNFFFNSAFRNSKEIHFNSFSKFKFSTSSTSSTSSISNSNEYKLNRENSLKQFELNQNKSIYQIDSNDNDDNEKISKISVHQIQNQFKNKLENGEKNNENELFEINCRILNKRDR